jgi:hypothetical protein
MKTKFQFASCLTPVVLGYVFTGCASTVPVAPPSTSPTSSITPSSSPSGTVPSNNGSPTPPAPPPPNVPPQSGGTRYLGPIQFAPGATFASVSNFVNPSGIDRYTFNAAAGQPAKVQIYSATGQVALTLVAPDGTPLLRSQSGGSSWAGTLPLNGTYRLDAVNNYIGSQYTVNLTIQPASGGGAQIHYQGRIQFPPGATYTTANGFLAPRNIDRYTFSAAAGQPANLSVSSPNGQVLLTLVDPQGNPLVRYQSGANSWSGRLTASGNYRVDVVNQAAPSAYTLGLSIMP